MDHVINLVRLEAEYFAKASSDFVNENHAFQSVLAGKLLVILAGSNDHWVVVVVAVLTRLMALDSWVVSEHCAI